MTTFTDVPKEVDEILEKWSGTTSRRTFLKNSGLFVVSISASAIVRANPLSPGAGGGSAGVTQAGDLYPDPDFRRLDSWLVIHEHGHGDLLRRKDRRGPGHRNRTPSDDVR